MHRRCKDIDITDWQTAVPWVTDCINRHKKRHDFRGLLVTHGLKKNLYYQLLRSDDLLELGVPKEDQPAFYAHRQRLLDAYYTAIENVTKDACERIRRRNLDLRPVTIREKLDKTTGKVRLIGNELAMQQVFDYIAVHAADDIFSARIVPQQASSIPDRGQIYGKKMIRKWISKDEQSARYAKRHHLRYTRKCRYFVKLDIRKCYNSARMEIFMRLFRRDCKNEDLIWLWETLLASHRVDGYEGFMIGALPSQWGCQYMLSFAYRFVMGLHKERRGKMQKLVSHMVMFMDDMSLFSSSRKLLLKAVRELTTFLKDELGFTIKPNWHIQDILRSGIDMMGYVVYASGKVAIRARDFVRARRMAIRCTVKKSFCIKQAQRTMSFKGFFKNSDSRRAAEKYQLKAVFRFCGRIVSVYDKMINTMKRGMIQHDYLQCAVE